MGNTARIPLCDLGPGIARDRARLVEAFERALDSGEFVLGASVERFERQLAEFLGVPEVVGVASGSDALELSLRALGVGPGQAVVTTPFTFVATAESIANAGATPVFADVRGDDWLLDLDAIDDALAALPRGPSGRPRLPSGEEVSALMPVHLFGAVLDPGKLRRLRERHHMLVVEDAAQALGGSAAGEMAGALGDAGCFSFFPSKTLGGFGDGGAVALRDTSVARRLRALRQHGQAGRQQPSVERGRNSRLDALQAALLSIKLDHLAADVAERRALLASYARALAPASPRARALVETPSPGHAAQQMIARCERRDEVAARLGARGIATAVYYPQPLHALAPYAGSPRLGPLPQAEAASRQSLALPLYPGMPAAAVSEVCGAVVEALEPPARPPG